MIFYFDFRLWPMTEENDVRIKKIKNFIFGSYSIMGVWLGCKLQGPLRGAQNLKSVPN